jgi:hypothetical protein
MAAGAARTLAQGEDMPEQGSDAQMTPEQRAQLQERLDRDRAAVTAEEARTAAAPEATDEP